MCHPEKESISPLQVGVAVGIINLTVTYSISVASGKSELESGILALGVGVVSGGIAFSLAELL